MKKSKQLKEELNILAAVIGTILQAEEEKTGIQPIEFKGRFGQTITRLYDFDKGQFADGSASENKGSPKTESSVNQSGVEKKGTKQALSALENVLSNQGDELASRAGDPSSGKKVKEVYDQIKETVGQMLENIGLDQEGIESFKEGVTSTFNKVKSAMSPDIGKMAEALSKEQEKIYGAFADKFPAMDRFLNSREFPLIMGQIFSVNNLAAAAMFMGPIGAISLVGVGALEMGYKQTQKNLQPYKGEKGLEKLLEESRLSKGPGGTLDAEEQAMIKNFHSTQIESPKGMANKAFPRRAMIGQSLRGLGTGIAIATVAMTAIDVAIGVSVYASKSPEKKAQAVREGHKRSAERLGERLKETNDQDRKEELVSNFIDSWQKDFASLPKDVQKQLEGDPAAIANYLYRFAGLSLGNMDKGDLIAIAEKLAG